MPGGRQDRIEHVHVEAEVVTHGLHQLNGPKPTAPKTEVIPDDRSTDAESVDENILDEVLSRARGKLGVEMHHVQIIDAEPIKVADLRAQGRQFKPGRFGLEETAGMGIKRQNAARGSDIASQRLGVFNYGLMAQMHAVEIADGDNGALRKVGKLFVMTENTQSFSLSSIPVTDHRNRK